MLYRNITQVPNVIFDTYLPLLSESELKVLLVVIRQTLGWIDRRSGKRKLRDRISISQFITKTGLSKRIISIAIQKLSLRGLLEITDYKGNKLIHSQDRKGRTYLFYAVKNPEHLTTLARVKSVPSPEQNCDHNKRKEKNVRQKPVRNFQGHIGELIARKALYSNPQEKG